MGDKHMFNASSHLIIYMSSPRYYNVLLYEGCMSLENSGDVLFYGFLRERLLDFGQTACWLCVIGEDSCKAREKKPTQRLNGTTQAEGVVLR